MPKSRGRNKNHHRRPGRSRDARRSVQRSSNPWPAEAVRLVQQVNALERSGDATGALELAGRSPLTPDGRAIWTRSRIERLLEVDVFGPQLPPWALGRWLRAQAFDHVGRRDTDRLRAAFADVSRTRLPVPADDVPSIQDWVLAQSYLYDHAGLRTFLRTASPDLLARASGVTDWPDAEMGAFRFLGDRADTIRWLRLDTDEEVETLNLGCAAALHQDDHVIGRLATSGTDALFESPPLAVPGVVAAAVAHHPSAWVECLAEHGERLVGGAPRAVPGAVTGLLTDLPDKLWQDLAHSVWDRVSEDRTQGASAHGEPSMSDVMNDACVELVLAAMVEQDAAAWLPTAGCLRDPWPAVAAALQRPGVSLSLVIRMLRDGYGSEDLLVLGERLGGFARTMCGVVAPAEDAAT